MQLPILPQTIWHFEADGVLPTPWSDLKDQTGLCYSNICLSSTISFSLAEDICITDMFHSGYQCLQLCCHWPFGATEVKTDMHKTTPWSPDHSLVNCTMVKCTMVKTNKLAKIIRCTSQKCMFEKIHLFNSVLDFFPTKSTAFQELLPWNKALLLLGQNSQETLCFTFKKICIDASDWYPVTTLSWVFTTSGLVCNRTFFQIYCTHTNPPSQVFSYTCENIHIHNRCQFLVTIPHDVLLNVGQETKFNANCPKLVSQWGWKLAQARLPFHYPWQHNDGLEVEQIFGTLGKVTQLSSWIPCIPPGSGIPCQRRKKVSILIP